MEDKVAALKSKRNNSTDEDDANSEHSTDEEAQIVEKKKARSWNSTNYWEYADSLLVELEGGPELTAEQRRKKYEE